MEAEKKEYVEVGASTKEAWVLNSVQKKRIMF
jgi:hypothetical protein